MAFHWAEEGHKVHVVTGIPNYPAGKFFPGYGVFKKRHELVNGVKVTHLPIVPRGNNKIMLMLNYFSFLIVGCFTFYGTRCFISMTSYSVSNCRL